MQCFSLGRTRRWRFPLAAYLIEKSPPWRYNKTNPPEQLSTTNFTCLAWLLATVSCKIASLLTIVAETERRNTSILSNLGIVLGNPGRYLIGGLLLVVPCTCYTLLIESSIEFEETRRTTMHIAYTELVWDRSICLLHCVSLVHRPAKCTVETDRSPRVDDKIYRRCCCCTPNLDYDASWDCDVYARSSCA